MAQDRGLIARGLLLFGLILSLTLMVLMVVLRQSEAAPQALADISKRAASPDGWNVRYNATVALARRGSTKLPCDELADMLDEPQQLRNFMLKAPDGVETLDEQAARRTVVNGLKALSEWLKHDDAVKAVAKDNAAGFERVHAAVDKLTQSDNTALRTEAENVKKTLGPR